MWIKFFLCLVYFTIKVDGYLELTSDQSTFDNELYESVLDPELCARQLKYLMSNNTLLLLTFLDAGFRLPRGILQGNTRDFGHYYQCLNINEQLQDTNIQGKYCTINVKLSGLSKFQSPWLNYDTAEVITDEVIKKSEENFKILNHVAALHNAEVTAIGQGVSLNQAICIPAQCSVEQALSTLFKILPFEYTEDFCRLPNDKPWVPADYIAIVFFSLIAFLTLVGTCYELIHIFVKKRDAKDQNKYLAMWSLYSNTRKLVTFKTNASSTDCLDGIRSIAMAWVILGHSATFQFNLVNPLDVLQWVLSADSIYITAAPITVDTFFFLGGVLLVYTSIGKLTGGQFLKSLHVFYLSRLIRLLPILATAVLLQVSLWHHILDGPMWGSVANSTIRCREFWWSTLLFIQNYVNPEFTCLTHSWYLAIEFQLYICSPLVLYWVLTDKPSYAWVALTCGVIVSVAAGSVFSFLMKLPGQILSFRSDGASNYLIYYYKNTLTRASPFFIGMLVGYILYIFKGKKLEVPKYLVALFWILSAAIAFLVFYSTYRMTQLDWNNQTIDSLVNSFMRPCWSLALGWLVLACAHGYAGPINGILSLYMWKLLARVSYGMYMFHLPIMTLIDATSLYPHYFTVLGVWLNFVLHFSISFVIAAVVTITIDAPVSSLLTIMIGGGMKKEKTEVTHLRENKETPSSSGHQDKN